MSTFLRVVFAMLVFVPTLIGQEPAESRPTSAPATRPSISGVDVRDLIGSYVADRRDLQEFYDIDLSSRRAERLETFHKSWLDLLTRVDFDALNQDARIDYLLLRNTIQRELMFLVLNSRRRTAIGGVLPFGREILRLENTRRGLGTVSPEEAASLLNDVRKKIDDTRRKLEATKSGTMDQDQISVSPENGARAAKACLRLRGVLEQWYRNSAAFDPVMNWWTKNPYEDAHRSLGEYAQYLNETWAGIKGRPDDPLYGEPIGEDILQADLASEMMAYTADELVRIADRHFTWCEVEMKKAAAEMGFGEDWKKALEKIKNSYETPGRHFDYVASVAREAVSFCDQNMLVNIPDVCRETWRLDMLDGETQKMFPFANYGGLLMNVAAPTADMDHDRKLQSFRGNNRHFTRLVTPHELIPGHHLQAYYAARVRPYRGHFETPFFVEGWAVYGEMLFWELGFQKSPEDRIGALLWRMHRCARVTVSLSFHLGRMKAPEMVDYLVNRVGLERDNAVGEVRRYISGSYSPLYQCGYLIGALQIDALRREVVDGKNVTLKQFNDFLLSQNAIPIELIRAALLNQPLTRDHRASWRFAGEPGQW